MKKRLTEAQSGTPGALNMPDLFSATTAIPQSSGRSIF